MRVILGTGNGEHFWASLCWSIFLLRPLSEDVVLDSGGWDVVGASGMGDGDGDGMVMVMGRGVEGAGPGGWSCGRNGCSPGWRAGWISFQGGVLFVAFFSSLLFSGCWLPKCWRHAAMAGASWIPACGVGLGAVVGAGGRGRGSKGNVFLGEYCGSRSKVWIFSRMVPWPFSWAQARRLWMEGSLLLIFVILGSGCISRKRGRKSAVTFCQTPVDWRHSQVARSRGGSRSVCDLSLRWLAARSPTFLRASFPFRHFPTAPATEVSLSEFVSKWTFTLITEVSITVRYLTRSLRILESVGTNIFVVKGE